jgi:hypothetical protein
MLSSYSPSALNDFTMPCISTLSINSLGQARMSQSGATPASAAWPVANTAYFFPFTVADTVTFTRAHWYNGATAAGNVDCGIYSETGTRLASTGAIAQGTINVVQTTAFTASVSLTPGRYYMALSFSLATGTIFGGGASLLHKIGGAYTQASAHPLPATATFATWTSTSLIPMFAVSTLGA